LSRSPVVPGAVPITSTYALTNATMPYLIHLATAGVRAAVAENRGLKLGVNVAGGQVTYGAVAEATGVEAVAVEEAVS
jgi:alanine dehydrogenase